MGTGRLTRVLAAAGLAFVLLPLAVVVVTSFGATEYVAFPPRGWSVRAWADALTRTEFLDSLLLSLELAGIVAVVATTLGTAAALGLRMLPPGAALRLEALFLAPLAVPHLVLGVAILQVIGLLMLGVSLPVLVAGHLVICLPYATRLVVAALATIDPNTERAAAVLGASAWYTVWHVTLPHVRPAVVASLFITATVSFDDVGIALFLSNADTETLPVRIFHYVEYQFAPFIAALGAVLIAVPVVAAVLVERWFGLGRLFGLATRR